MKADQARSIRLGVLLQMALNGSTIDQLEQKCILWGVTRPTIKSYIETVIARVRIMKE